MQRISLTLLAMLLSLSAMAQSSVSNYETAKHLDIFNRLYKELDLNYVDSLAAKDIIEDAIYYMLEQLDPYTTYYPEEEQDDLRQLTTGKYAGVGSLISYHKDHDRCIISEPYANMPAAQAGLRCGDVILAIDGIEMPKCGKRNVRAYSDSVSSAMRGEPGTQLRIRVERYGEPKPLDFTITRRSIQLPTVDFCRMINDSIGIIGLNAFHENTAQEVRQAILNLKSQGMRRLLLDLRGNGGGLMNEAMNIVSLFVPKGSLVVSSKGNVNVPRQEFRTTTEPVDTEIPIIVLVDSGTASSSEIVSGAFQDLDRATIMGRRTYGKGLVQSVRPLPYNGQLKVTTAKYYTPSGRCIQAIDYSHRNEDGSVGHIPDSLTHKFYTAHGRPVRDGGGITPDDTLSVKEYSRLVYSLVLNGIIDRYSLEYARKHESIPALEDFHLTDADYADFVEYAKGQDFDYRSSAKTWFDQMKKELVKDGMAESMSSQLDALEKGLNMEKEQFLLLKKSEIVPFIEEEIAVRYYYQEAGIQVRLRYDTQLREALTKPLISVVK